MSQSMQTSDKAQGNTTTRQQVFRFLDLSAELRIHIYNSVCDNEPPRIRSGPQGPYISHSSGLVLANKQLHDEFVAHSTFKAPSVIVPVKDSGAYFRPIMKYLEQLPLSELMDFHSPTKPSADSETTAEPTVQDSGQPERHLELVPPKRRIVFYLYIRKHEYAAAISFNSWLAFQLSFEKARGVHLDADFALGFCDGNFIELAQQFRYPNQMANAADIEKVQAILDLNTQAAS